MHLAILIAVFVSLAEAECSNCGCQSQAYIESLKAWKQSREEWQEEMAEWKKLKEQRDGDDCLPPTTRPDVSTTASTTAQPSTTQSPTIAPSSTAYSTTTQETSTSTHPPIPVFYSGQCKEVCLGIENGSIRNEPVGFASSGAAVKIQPEFAGEEGINIYCDCSFGPDEAWMVFQRRMDGSVDFNRYWDEYVDGFGSPFGEFWLGLEGLSNFTAEGDYELRIDLKDWENDTVYAVYGHFSIGGPSTNYAIQFSGYSGTAGDAFNQHSGDQFSTRDRDNDLIGHFDCAGTYTGGWWFNNCHLVNLNGEYYHGGSSPYARGIHWDSAWHGGYSYSLKATEMKFRKVSLTTTPSPPTTAHIELTTSPTESESTIEPTTPFDVVIENGTFVDAESCIEVCEGIESGTIESHPVGLSTTGAGARIHPDFAGEEGIKTYCDCSFGTDDGWMVFQRRMDGSVDFNRYWDDYVAGFGNPFGEFWLGLDALSILTAEGEYELRIDLQDWVDDQVYAVYGHFSIGGPSTNYTIQFSGYSGTAGDAFNQHSGDQFSTRDRDNDLIGHFDCAGTYTGGWWFNNCHPVNLNGEYYHGGSSPFARGIHWDSAWHGGYSYSLKATEMKFRRINVLASTTAELPTSTRYAETTSTYPTTLSATTDGANDGLCEIEYNGKCFWTVLHDGTDISFTAAETICANSDSAVANIYDAEHDRLVMEHFRSKLNGRGHFWVWIGMTIDPSSQIVSLRDGTPATYEFWYSSSSYPISTPTNTNILHTIVQDPESNQNGWQNVQPEFNVHGVVCELN